METKISTYTEFRRVYEKAWETFRATGNDEILLSVEDTYPEFNLRMSFDIFREIEARGKKNDNE